MAASDARQYVAEREAAAEQAQVTGKQIKLCRGAVAVGWLAFQFVWGCGQLFNPHTCISAPCALQAAHKAASRSSIEAQDRVRQLEGELRRLQASQGGCMAGWVLVVVALSAGCCSNVQGAVPSAGLPGWVAGAGCRGGVHFMAGARVGGCLLFDWLDVFPSLHAGKGLFI